VTVGCQHVLYSVVGSLLRFRDCPLLRFGEKGDVVGLDLADLYADLLRLV